jgi:predicted nucleotidyltransferase
LPRPAAAARGLVQSRRVDAQLETDGDVGAIETVLSALNAAGVRYLVVGGVAVVLHGHLRTTADVALVVELTRENTLAAVRALAQLGYGPRAPVSAEGFADAATRETWSTEKGLTVFSLWSDRSPGLEVDLFVSEPFDFDEAYGRSVRVSLDATTATVVSLSDLIQLKRAAGRPMDLADIEALVVIDQDQAP